MLIPIYYGKRFTFNVVVERRAEIICVSCKNAFAVTDYAGAIGSSFSILGLQDEKASEGARKAAIKSLGKSVAQLSPTPCPYCSQFQPAMKHYLNWITGQKILFAFMIGMTVLGTGGLAYAIQKNMRPSELAVLIGAGLAAVAFLLYRYFKDLRLQPVQVEKLSTTKIRPLLRIGIRNDNDPNWTWIDDANE